jgi:hypothetical protein
LSPTSPDPPIRRSAIRRFADPPIRRFADPLIRRSADPLSLDSRPPEADSGVSVRTAGSDDLRIRTEKGDEMSAHVPPLSRRVLTVFLLVGIPILVLGVALVLALGQARLRDLNGQHLEQVASQTAAGVDAYVYRRLLDVSLLARVPDVRAAATAATRQPFDKAAAERIDAEWAAAKTAPASVASVLTSPAARYLADIAQRDPTYKELLLTDRSGRLVAASNPTTDYYQADEDWWENAYGHGRGQVALSDVSWDASSGRHAIQIAVPVTSPEDESLVGILKVVSDSREMLALVGGVQLGNTGEAQLVRPDASIVYSRRTVEPSARFFAADALRERVARLVTGTPLEGSWFQAEGANGQELMVGMAPSQLSRSYPNVAWFVVVTQATDELMAPVASLGWYLLLSLALTAIAILIFALWFSMRLAAPPLEADMHLVEHPMVTHVGADEPILPETPEEVATRRRLA